MVHIRSYPEEDAIHIDLAEGLAVSCAELGPETDTESAVIGYDTAKRPVYVAILGVSRRPILAGFPPEVRGAVREACAQLHLEMR